MLKVAFGFGIVLAMVLVLRVPNWNNAIVVTRPVQGKWDNVPLKHCVVVNLPRLSH